MHGNFRILPPFRIYLNSILVILKPKKLPFLPFQHLCILIFCDFLTFQSVKFQKKSKFKAPKWMKWQFFTFWYLSKMVSHKILVAEKSWNFHTMDLKGLKYTVGKFHDFSITQILREINLEDCRSAKSAISTHLQPLKFDSYEFLHFLRAEIYQINKF